jgi:hypothetical protein
VDLNAAASPVPDGHGGLRGLMIVFTDQTERKRLERERDRLREQLQQNEEQQNEESRCARASCASGSPSSTPRPPS